MTEGRRGTCASAAVLAGGASRRMGADKAFVPWHQTTLLQHQLATLRALQPEELLISGRSGVVYPVSDARVVLDTTRDAGPLAGLLSLLEAARNDHVILLAVDMPFVTAEFLRGLLAVGTTGRTIVPRVQDRWEPFAALYSRTLIPAIGDALGRGDRSLQTLLDGGRAAGIVTALPETRADLFVSLNTPQSHQQAQAR